MVRPIEDYCCGSSDEAYFRACGKKAPPACTGIHTAMPYLDLSTTEGPRRRVRFSIYWPTIWFHTIWPLFIVPRVVGFLVSFRRLFCRLWYLKKGCHVCCNALLSPKLLDTGGRMILPKLRGLSRMRTSLLLRVFLCCVKDSGTGFHQNKGPKLSPFLPITPSGYPPGITQFKKIK